MKSYKLAWINSVQKALTEAIQNKKVTTEELSHKVVEKLFYDEHLKEPKPRSYFKCLKCEYIAPDIGEINLQQAIEIGHYPETKYQIYNPTQSWVDKCEGQLIKLVEVFE